MSQMPLHTETFSLIPKVVVEGNHHLSPEENQNQNGFQLKVCGPNKTTKYASLQKNLDCRATQKRTKETHNTSVTLRAQSPFVQQKQDPGITDQPKPGSCLQGRNQKRYCGSSRNIFSEFCQPDLRRLKKT